MCFLVDDLCYCGSVVSDVEIYWRGRNPHPWILVGQNFSNAKLSTTTIIKALPTLPRNHHNSARERCFSHHNPRTMPSVSNPNGPSRNRQIARATKARAQRRKKSEHAKNKIAKADTSRGARPGLLPTSGPRAKISKKKARKLEKKMGHALRRQMEADGELVMKGRSWAQVESFAGRVFANWRG